jgi:hypothetical protein
VTLFVLLIVVATVVGIVVSAASGSRVARRLDGTRLSGTVFVLAGLTLVAAVVALAIGVPGRESPCSASLRDDVAAVIAVGAIPSIVIVVILSLGAVAGSRSRKPSVLGLAVALTAAIVDWIAIAHSVRFCLN